MGDVAVMARVSGRVQGVAFRVWTQIEARSLGLRGWVRNEADRTVCALLVGPEAKVGEMVRRLHEGPPAAVVTDVETTAGDPRDAGPTFEVERSVR